MRRESEAIQKRLRKAAAAVAKNMGRAARLTSTSPEGLSEVVQMIADEPGRKIEAIKVHRLETGLGLKEAKDSVEAYIARRRRVGPP
jgi:ribosomal protein L7/L12